MLDKIFNYPVKTEFVTKKIDVTKHEHRAPTEQSIELLREMERAAD